MKKSSILLFLISLFFILSGCEKTSKVAISKEDFYKYYDVGVYHKVTGMYSVRYDVEVTPKNNYELTSGTCTLVLPVYYEYYVFNTKLKQWRDIQVTINLSSYSKTTGSANITTGVQPVGAGIGGSFYVTELSAEQYITTTTYLPEILILSSILTMSIIVFFVYKNKKNKQKELLANQSDLSNNQIIN